MIQINTKKFNAIFRSSIVNAKSIGLIKKSFYSHTHKIRKIPIEKIKNEFFSPFLVERRQFADAIRARESDEKTLNCQFSVPFSSESE